MYMDRKKKRKKISVGQLRARLEVSVSRLVLYLSSRELVGEASSLGFRFSVANKYFELCIV